MDCILDDIWDDSRQRLIATLALFRLSVFEWICLNGSINGTAWSAPLGRTMYQEIVNEDLWYGNISLPDITLDVMNQADASIKSRGLIQKVKRPLAEAMRFERHAYDQTPWPLSSLIERRILDEKGIEIWHAVQRIEGQFVGRRFIRLLSKQRIEPYMVIHSIFQFDLNLLCTECADSINNGSPNPLVSVGPWFGEMSQTWPYGWRLLCPHLFIPHPNS